MAWYLNRALSTLRAEVNNRWPRRDRTSDGTIGDAAHQATSSDHNPDPDGSVDAWDMDINGVDVAFIIDRFERHEAARYWIYNRQIASRSTGWTRQRYTGSNPHDMHVHFNTREGYENSAKPWGIGEEEMDQATFNARMLGALRNSAVAANLRGLPWQYPAATNRSALGTLLTNESLLFTTLRAINAKLDLLAASAGVDPVVLAEIRAQVEAARTEQEAATRAARAEVARAEEEEAIRLAREQAAEAESAEAARAGRADYDEMAAAATAIAGLTPEQVAVAVADALPDEDAEQAAALLSRAVAVKRSQPR